MFHLQGKSRTPSTHPLSIGVFLITIFLHHGIPEFSWHQVHNRTAYQHRISPQQLSAVVNPASSLAITMVLKARIFVPKMSTFGSDGTGWLNTTSTGD
jgi:hypothetical protein